MMLQTIGKKTLVNVDLHYKSPIIDQQENEAK